MIHWLLRAKRWAQNPPSMRKVLWGLAVIAACLALVGIEALGLWPEWATADRRLRPTIPNL